MGQQGRLVIPADIREQLGLQPGDELQLDVVADGQLVLQRKQDAARALRGSLAALAPGRSLVDELLTERRAEAARE